MRILSLLFMLPLYLMAHNFPVITSSDQLHEIFPTTADEVAELVIRTKNEFATDIDKIIAIPKQDRTFENTIRAMDLADEKVSVVLGIMEAVGFTSPVEETQKAARKATEEISQVVIEQTSENRAFYYAIKDYVDKGEELEPHKQYYVEMTMRGFEDLGHLLPQEERKEVKNLLQRIVTLQEEFQNNIMTDQSHIDLFKEQLEGLPESFFEGLSKTEDGKYRLFCDYPTYLPVIDHCVNPETRKAFYRVFMNRAYPKNETTLIELIETRNAYARKLGYPSYAHQSLRSQMALSPKKVDVFLSHISNQLSLKEKGEYEEFKKSANFEQMVNERGQILPWNFRYLSGSYLKDQFFVDKQKVAEYFPLNIALKGMSRIFGDFLDINIKIEHPSNLWSDELISLRITDRKDQKLLGFILLDLFPRKNKYSHACMMKVLPSQQGDYPSVKMIIANFPTATSDKPALMPHDQVTTLFHEFGHAIHGVLGKTDLYGQAGTNVKTDFVELPSQLLEEWAWDPDVLKLISAHYKTKEPLPDEMIQQLLAARYANAGFFYRRQISLSYLSLDCYSGDPIHNTQELNKTIDSRHRPWLASDPEVHFTSNFGHLSGYGAKYYSYLWTRVMAAEVFAEIKKMGLGKEAGQKYREMILEKGGSMPPQDLVRNFLGREPTHEAFLKNIFSKEEFITAKEE